VRYFVRTSEPLVALTFDDGPGPHWTPRVLDALDEAGVPATFFMVGQHVEQHGALVRDRLQRHEVGNHSWSHRDFATLDRPAIEADLRRAEDMIYRRLGRNPRLLRPPFGHLGGSTLLAANALGYDDVILWNREMHENRFAGKPAEQAQDLIASAAPGTIILAHDLGDDRRLTSIRALPALVDGLRSRGYTFVTVSAMLAAGTVSKA
jgi:peptidoglycan/xylan/chitin deacetylase (PgdA/CDA1 family)